MITFIQCDSIIYKTSGRGHYKVWWRDTLDIYLYTHVLHQLAVTVATDSRRYKIQRNAVEMCESLASWFNDYMCSVHWIKI